MLGFIRNRNIVFSVPYPNTSPRMRGIHARGAGKVCAGHTYYSREEFDLVRLAAARTGLTYSEFTRWCSVKVAEQVLGDKDDGTIQLELPL